VIRFEICESIFFTHLNYGLSDLSLIICSNKCFHNLWTLNNEKKSIKIHLKQHFLMQTLQIIHFVYFWFGFHIFFSIVYRSKSIVFIFIIGYSNLTYFGLHVVGLFLYEDFSKMIFIWLMLKLGIGLVIEL